MKSTRETYGPVTIELLDNAERAKDAYASNIPLTGHSSHWFGSTNMSNFIASSSFTETPDRLLELGTGVGRAGIVASLIFPTTNVVLTDGEQSVLEITAQNVRLNNNNSTSSDVVSAATTLLFKWGCDETIKSLKKFNVIIGCDLLYGPDALEAAKALFYSVSALLVEDDASVFYLAYTKRDTIDLDTLFNLAKRKEFGFKSIRMLEEYTFDIFDNNDVSAESVFWRDTILEFKK